jgi:hypothetical protein
VKGVCVRWMALHGDEGGGGVSGGTTGCYTEQCFMCTAARRTLHCRAMLCLQPPPPLLH